jgi:hypothetical protein
MKLNLKQLQKLHTEGQLTDFALKGLPSYPDSYTLVGLTELVEFESELRKEFRGVSLVKGVNKYYYDFETETVFLCNDYVGFRDSNHYKVSVSELVEVVNGTRSLDEFPIDSDLDLCWFLETQEKEVLVGLLYKALKGK